MIRLGAFLAYALVMVWPGETIALEGFATVVSGDVIEVKGRRLHLLGVGAPDLDQTCAAKWRCGEAAARALKIRIGTDPVRCEFQGQTEGPMTQGLV